MIHNATRWFLVSCAASALLLNTHAYASDGTLKVYWIDCDGGASTLIVTPMNESILVDSGFPGPRDPARIERAAKDAGITQIDHFILSHFHRDHFGGAPVLAQTLPIRTVYDQGIPPRNLDTDAGSEAFFRLTVQPYAEMQVEKRVVMRPGMTIPLKAGGNARAKALLRCLAIKQQFITPDVGLPINPLEKTSGPDPKSIATENLNSAVVLLTFGQFRLYLGGDLNWYQEEKLVSPYNLVGEVDVFQSDTHGLNTSNPPILLRSLAPVVAVINNGPKKGGSPETIARLKAEPSIKAIFQLHYNTLTSPEENTDSALIANIDEGCSGEYIKMSVAPDGESYTISIPARGFAATYRTKGKP